MAAPRLQAFLEAHQIDRAFRPDEIESAIAKGKRLHVGALDDEPLFRDLLPHRALMQLVEKRFEKIDRRD